MRKRETNGEGDAALLRDVLAGDQRAWSRMVRRHEPALRRLVGDIVGEDSDVDIEDVIGDFWLRMLDRDKRWLRAFAGGSCASLDEWLAVHASQVAHEHRRKRDEHRRRTTTMDEACFVAAPIDVEPVPTVDSAIRAAVRDVVREEIAALLARMPAANVAVEPASEYLSIGDAARLVDVHPATIRSWIHEGRLRGHRAGRHHRVKRAELETFLSSMDADEIDLDARARELATA